MQDFGEHGRELVTVEVALRVLDLLADPSRVEQLVQKRGGNAEKLAALLERCVFKVICCPQWTVETCPRQALMQ